MEEAPVPGLYLHIPFCRSRCAYCDFYSVTDTGLIPRYLDALLKELEAYRDEFTSFDTVYLGGGTPSLLSIAQIGALMDTIRQVFTIVPDAETTIEVNPADWDREALGEVHGLGINRLSIGIQSLDDQELLLLGRRHDRKQALRTLEDALHAGFTNIGIDLIYGLPGQTLQGWFASLRQALTFSPAHLSCYELEIKDGTPLGRRYKKGEFSRPPEETQRDFFMRTSEFLEESGYIHYEVSNFAMDMDHASRHNQKYWDHTPYLGVGPSAHSFRDRRRWWNHGALDRYLLDLEGDRLPIDDAETLDDEQLGMEALFLGLRTKQGIDLERYRRQYGFDLMEDKALLLKELCASGLIEIFDGRLRPTRAGMAVADSLAML